ncbi:MAG TPA: apolipoprotein N-acyltransferase [Propionibacteriaceae bacterium]|nr:apolipoprotein N-acyltransferase [Propionibacteriaceae bacterium]
MSRPRASLTRSRAAGTPTELLEPAQISMLPRFAVVLVAGAALGLSWQPYGFWPLLLVAIPAFTLGVRGVRPAAALGLGYLFGLTMLLFAVSWLHVLGTWIAALLIIFMALFFGLLGLTVTLVSGLRWWPLATACCWVLIEYAYSRIPFGGFGWTRIAYAAVDTPLAGFFPIIGVAGVSFAVALIGQLIAWAILTQWSARRGRPAGRRQLLIAAALTVGLGLLGSALRLYQVEPEAGSASSVRVGIVQGNIPGRGIEAMGRARSVTNNHLSETIQLMTKARLGEVPEPDFVLWPENSTDIDPTVDPLTKLTVQAAADVADRPILVGAVMQGPGDDERQTAALWWDPERGVLARYDKQNLVPFGEWIPFRAQLLPLIPLLQQVGAQSIAGTRPGVLDVAVAGRPIKIGDVICFELAYDQTLYGSLIGGAQVMMVQSNNATYGGTGQIEQQFAITRARAMESRREIAVATTNSVSGFITRDGAVVARTQEFTAQSMVVDMPLRSALTPAVRVAPWLERSLALLAILACLAAALGWRAAVLKRSEQTRFTSSDDEVGALQSAMRAERAPASEAIKHEKETPVEPTDADDESGQRSLGGTHLTRPGTDSGDHSDLQRVGEHRPYRQPDP